MKSKSILLILISCLLYENAYTRTIDQKVDSVLKLMTIEEKIGQMTQYASFWSTGPKSPEGDKLKDIVDGKVGSLLNIVGTDKARAMQELAQKSRLKIPLILGLDVIHGFNTSFPIPLAEAASWDMKVVEQSARIAATEASAGGVNWTFAPMVDIARDPRWGRVMEGAGEDPYLGARVAAARVRGFLGEGLGSKDAIMCTAKHFAAYGAGIGGREYNSADMSERTLHEIYLPPFKAAVEAGASTIMNSLHDLNGVPTTGNTYLVRKVLKGDWNFQGYVISDWGSIAEIIKHGYVKDTVQAALVAIDGGTDMDMECRAYRNQLPALVASGKVSMSLIDDAVRRILKKKFELGLFDNPYKYCDSEREVKILNNPQHRIIARDVAKRSIVLLKNSNHLLPLNPQSKIALIGPLAQSKKDMLGAWSISKFDDGEVVSLYDAMLKRVGKEHLIYAKGCEVEDTSRVGFKQAIQAAKAADVVVISVGEKREMTGEAASRSNLHLPGVQEQLIRLLYETGKPMVVLINSGRPLVFNWTADHIPSILYTWWLGSEAGNAMVDVIFGDYNPSAKLPITFPRNEGQIPIYYNHHHTGRPPVMDTTSADYKGGYLDLVYSPKFYFGYGLSYTTFEYSDFKLIYLNEGENLLKVSFTITNTGKVAGEEIVQLYIRDKVATPVRPVKELKDFSKLMLQPLEKQTVEFVITKDKLSYYNQEMKWSLDPGWFEIMVGSSSKDIQHTFNFELEKE
jgi:beta-glucosidase